MNADPAAPQGAGATRAPATPTLARPGTPLREAITAAYRRPEAEALAGLREAATLDAAA